MTPEEAKALRKRLGHARQYGFNLSEIKPNHLWRYRWAANLVKGQRVLDAGCGIGYGSSVLSREAVSVIGLEFDPGVVEFAREHWSAPNVTYQECELLTGDIPTDVDVCVAFESLEHIIAPEIFLSQLPVGCLLLASTPNETTRPIARSQNPHHFQHYTDQQIEALLKLSGFSEVQEWFSQDFGELEPGKKLRTLIFRATKRYESTVDIDELRRSLVSRLTAAMLVRNNRIRAAAK